MSTNQRQCNPKGNVSFPLRFTSGNISSIPVNDPQFIMSFESRSTNPKFEDASRTGGGIIDEPSSSFTILYNNYTYTLLTTQICLAQHPILANNNKIDIILTLESTKDLQNRHLAPVAFIMVAIPLIELTDDEMTQENLFDNTYLANLLNNNIPGTYNIKDLFTGLKKFIWYETCLEPHGDNAIAYISSDGIKISKNLYWNLLATWRKDSPFDIQKENTNAVSKIKKDVNDFCQNVSTTEDINILDNSINTLQASKFVPKLNKRIETWPNYTAPYDIVLNVEANFAVTSSMTDRGVEGFQSAPTITGVYVTETGGVNPMQRLTFPTGTPPSEAEIIADLQRISARSVDGKTIDLGQFKCVPLDMDGAIDASGIHFDAMGNPLSDLYKSRNALRADTQVNKVGVYQLEKYFAYAIAILAGLLFLIYVIPFLYNKFIKQTSPIELTMLPSQASQLGFYLIMGCIMGGIGFMVGAAVTSLI